jgi:hypothetical protein|tara:strand:+ start:328 stop:582 length:255 start_codon:yes stop_codon:yes gene_type:complete
MSNLNEMLNNEINFAENWINSQEDKKKIWLFFATEEPPKDEGYSFWQHKYVNKLNIATACRGHSGSSFGIIMRCLQSLSKTKYY